MRYLVTPTGPLGFQVTASNGGSNLIGDFTSLSEAEAFAVSMRQIDAGQTDVTPPPSEPC